MKTPCKVIEDLLPLYCDNVCSEESKELINEHLSSCEQCTEVLEQMQIKVKAQSKVEIESLKSVKEQWFKSNKKSIIKGLIYGISICAVLVLLFIFLTQLCIFPVSTDKIVVSDVYELESHEIAFHLYVDDKFDLNAITVDITEDGVMYITPKRTIIENKRYKDFNEGLFNRDYVVCTSGEIEDYADFSYTDKEITAVYIGTKKDNILLWEDGMKLNKADSSTQERFTDNIV